jgi:hypothetical protein
MLPPPDPSAVTLFPPSVEPSPTPPGADRARVEGGTWAHAGVSRPEDASLPSPHVHDSRACWCRACGGDRAIHGLEQGARDMEGADLPRPTHMHDPGQASPSPGAARMTHDHDEPLLPRPAPVETARNSRVPCGGARARDRPTARAREREPTTTSGLGALHWTVFTVVLCHELSFFLFD